MFHYVYRITNITPRLEKYYIGVRSSLDEPNDDNYWSSSKYLKEDISTFGLSNFKKKIIKIFNNRKEAIDFEIKIQTKLQVHHHPLFYNKSTQPSNKFNNQGNPEIIKRKVQTMQNTIIDGKTLYQIAVAKGIETKKTKILPNGLTVSENQVANFIANLDIPDSKTGLTLRQKLRKPKNNTSNYTGNPKTVILYDSKDNIKHTINDGFQKYCLLYNLPYTAFRKSYGEQIPVYENITNPRTITLLKNKKYWQYKGWYAILKV
jgi:hypothetical protein